MISSSSHCIVSACAMHAHKQEIEENLDASGHETLLLLLGAFCISPSIKEAKGGTAHCCLSYSSHTLAGDIQPGCTRHGQKS